MLIVGLGNPGEKYTNHRHNIGFMAVQEVLRRHFPSATLKEKFKGFYTCQAVAGQHLHFLLPQTYMNNSGEAVQKAAHFFKIPVEDIVVIHDELDLDLGVVKLKKGGGHAGHNGLRSIIQHLSTQDFYRLRCGIGHPGDKNLVTPHVLGNFCSEEWPKVEDMCAHVADEVMKIMNKEEN